MKKTGREAREEVMALLSAGNVIEGANLLADYGYRWIDVVKERWTPPRNEPEKVKFAVELSDVNKAQEIMDIVNNGYYQFKETIRDDGSVSSEEDMVDTVFRCEEEGWGLSQKQKNYVNAIHNRATKARNRIDPQGRFRFGPEEPPPGDSSDYGNV